MYFLSEDKGFTLIEMMVILAIISILAVLVIPSSDHDRFNRAKIQESLHLIERYKPIIEQYYYQYNAFPTDNNQVGLPAPRLIKGNYLQSAAIENGAIHIQMGNKVSAKLSGKTLSIRPIFVPNIANAPVSWICGYDIVPSGMLASGENLTDIEALDLPLNCR